MTIRKGESWGVPGPLAGDGVMVRTDADIASELEAAHREQRPPRELGLLGGDLARTLGSTGSVARIQSPDAMRLPVDTVEATIDGVVHWFGAHLIARRPLWQGQFVAAMNAEYLRDWRMAPASHPNDGRVDLLVGRLSIGDRTKARQRLPAGLHLPHPAIEVRRVRDHRLVLPKRTVVWVDGIRVGHASELSLTVHPDAMTVVV